MYTAIRICLYRSKCFFFFFLIEMVCRVLCISHNTQWEQFLIASMTCALQFIYCTHGLQCTCVYLRRTCFKSVKSIQMAHFMVLLTCIWILKNAVIKVFKVPKPLNKCLVHVMMIWWSDQGHIPFFFPTLHPWDQPLSLSEFHLFSWKHTSFEVAEIGTWSLILLAM